MKTYHAKKGLTFGDYVASVYKTSGKRQARTMIQLAVNAHLVNFLGGDHFVISNRRGQDECLCVTVFATTRAVGWI